ncbi:MAG: plasmid pRiA4b ORF-3 family protein [Dehalococcoidia bacterium]|nr:plasmid pRiA4b ORF-3 family protein [Dehalococcoidia bacterium]
MYTQLGPGVETYQLKVCLREIRPQVWRRIQVSGDITLPRLHMVLQAVMGWTNSHLHMFTVDGTDYGEPDPDFPDDVPMIDERRKRLNKLVIRRNTRIIYAYDFGDNWQHDILVEKIFRPEPWHNHPFCLEGARACPPEDVGGVSGYRDFRRSIRHPRDPEHDSCLTWVGGAFDPEGFDINAVNRTLSGSRFRF